VLKKTITYIDYNDVERTEIFLFNLTKAEVTEMELSIEGGLVEKINHIVTTKNGGEIIRLFKEIILKAYGEKSPDGKRFVKSQDLSDAFSQTEAYSLLFMELATEAEKAAEFINAIVPAPSK